MNLYLSENEKTFLQNNLEVFQLYDINTAIRRLAENYVHLDSEESDECDILDIINFLADGTDMFNHITQDTCDAIIRAINHDHIYNDVILIKSNVGEIVNPYLKTMYFFVTDELGTNVTKISLPNATSIGRDIFEYHHGVLFDDAPYDYIISLPKLKLNRDLNFTGEIFEEVEEVWPDGLYFESNREAIDRILDMLRRKGWSAININKAKKHLKVV